MVKLFKSKLAKCYSRIANDEYVNYTGCDFGIYLYSQVLPDASGPEKTVLEKVERLHRYYHTAWAMNKALHHRVKSINTIEILAMIDAELSALEEI